MDIENLDWDKVRAGTLTAVEISAFRDRVIQFNQLTMLLSIRLTSV